MGECAIRRGGGSAAETWKIKNVNNSTSDPTAITASGLRMCLWLGDDFVPEVGVWYLVQAWYSYYDAAYATPPLCIQRVEMFLSGNLRFFGGKFSLPGSYGEQYTATNCQAFALDFPGYSIGLSMNVKSGSSSRPGNVIDFDGAVRKLKFDLL